MRFLGLVFHVMMWASMSLNGHVMQSFPRLIIQSVHLRFALGIYVGGEGGLVDHVTATMQINILYASSIRKL
jgi:hypothetical protein